MTDEQFTVLVDTLKPKKKLSWSDVIQGAITSVITAGLLAFFALIWSWGTEFKETSNKLLKAADLSRVQVNAINETLSARIAALEAHEQQQDNIITNTPAHNFTHKFLEDVQKNQSDIRWQIQDRVKVSNAAKPD